MAHYKRGYAKTKTRGRKRWLHKWRNGKPTYGEYWSRWMCCWPRYWDIEYHRRPKRREEQRLLVRIRQGDDPDGIAWPLGNHKPHRYYW